MFTNQSLKKLIIPLVIEQVLIMFVGLGDTMMVSSVGEAAISGVALVNMVNELVICILAAVATGGAVIVSQYIGSNRAEKANQSASQLLLITFVISMILMVISLVFYQSILQVLFGSVDVDVMNAATTYFLICACSFPFLGIYNSMSAVFRSIGSTKTTMVVSLMMNVINLVGNAIGVFVFHAGVAGVAIPTLISRAFAACVMYYLATNKENKVFITIKQIITFDKAVIKRILNIAIPNGIENGLFQLGRVLVGSIVALFSTTQIAANGVANSIDMIAIIVAQAINLAIITVVGQCAGANEYEQASTYIKKLMKIAYACTGILNIVVFLLLPFILQFFSLSEEAYKIAYTLIISHNLLAFFLNPTSFILPNGLRAVGDVKYTMKVGIFSMIVFRLGSAVFFGIYLNLGVYGVWIAMGVDWLFRSFAFVIRFQIGKWKHIRVIE